MDRYKYKDKHRYRYEIDRQDKIEYTCMLWLMVSRRRRPDMVVNSPGTAVRKNWPMRNIWRGRIPAVQGAGKWIAPVFSRIGFGVCDSPQRERERVSE
jgi:hypothetical protein